MKPAQIIIRGDPDRNLLKRWADRVPVGYSVTFAEKPHSSEQREKFHAMVREVAKSVEYYGKKRTEEAWKALFVAAYEKAEMLPGLDGETIVQIRRSTTTFGVKEYSDLIEIVYAYGAAHGVTFNDPAAAA